MFLLKVLAVLTCAVAAFGTPVPLTEEELNLLERLLRQLEATTSTPTQDPNMVKVTELIENAIANFPTLAAQELRLASSADLATMLEIARDATREVLTVLGVEAYTECVVVLHATNFLKHTVLDRLLVQISNDLSSEVASLLSPDVAELRDVLKATRVTPKIMKEVFEKLTDKVKEVQKAILIEMGLGRTDSSSELEEKSRRTSTRIPPVCEDPPKLKLTGAQLIAGFVWSTTRLVAKLSTAIPNDANVTCGAVLEIVKVTLNEVASQNFDFKLLIEELDLSKSAKSDIENSPIKALLITATQKLQSTVAKPIAFLRELLTSLENPEAVSKLNTVIEQALEGHKFESEVIHILSTIHQCTAGVPNKAITDMTEAELSSLIEKVTTEVLLLNEIGPVDCEEVKMAAVAKGLLQLKRLVVFGRKSEEIKTILKPIEEKIAEALAANGKKQPGNSLKLRKRAEELLLITFGELYKTIVPDFTVEAGADILPINLFVMASALTKREALADSNSGEQDFDPDRKHLPTALAITMLRALRVTNPDTCNANPNLVDPAADVTAIILDLMTLPEFTDEFFNALQTNVHKDCSSCNVTLELKPHLAQLLTNLSDEVSAITISKSSVAEQLGKLLYLGLNPPTNLKPNSKSEAN